MCFSKLIMGVWPSCSASVHLHTLQYLGQHRWLRAAHLLRNWPLYPSRCSTTQHNTPGLPLSHVYVCALTSLSCLDSNSTMTKVSGGHHTIFHFWLEWDTTNVLITGATVRCCEPLCVVSRAAQFRRMVLLCLQSWSSHSDTYLPFSGLRSFHFHFSFKLDLNAKISAKGQPCQTCPI